MARMKPITNKTVPIHNKLIKGLIETSAASNSLPAYGFADTSECEIASLIELVSTFIPLMNN